MPADIVEVEHDGLNNQDVHYTIHAATILLTRNKTIVINKCNSIKYYIVYTFIYFYMIIYNII